MRTKNEFKEEYAKDSVLRKYELKKTAEYLVRVDDQLHIRVASLTPSQYNAFDITNPSGLEGRVQNTQVIGGANGTIYGYEVNELGEIQMPLIGSLKAEGKTLKEVENEVQVALSKYVKDPVVYVRLLNFRFSILGEVPREGMYSTFNKRITAMEAIGQAGGFGELANRENVKLIRNNNGIAEVVYLDFLDEQFVASPYYYIQPNDVLVVQPLKQRPVITYVYKNVGLIASITSLVISVATLLSR
ncbi:polysaccharide biosynthesis/export family protein [Limibacter armeniacum]|uniref:polysaccharide biosynthesis/export family protein n=1 Tax=Limibacter armeniacum TaxID=466084 RepID=UPI002FE5EC55